MRKDWGENIQDKPLWKQVLCGLIMAICMLFMMWFAGALQEHYDCIRNIRPEVCIPADFEN